MSENPHKIDAASWDSTKSNALARTYSLADSSLSECISTISLTTEFYPRPYQFRIRNKNNQLITLDPKESSKSRVRCPEFHVLLDHAIAVIWMCYSDRQNWHDITPDQIQWAIRFLEGVDDKYNKKSDIASAIQDMQEILLTMYSEMEEDALPDISLLAEVTSENSTFCRSIVPHYPVSVTLNDMLGKLHPEKLMDLMEDGQTRNTEELSLANKPEAVVQEVLLEDASDQELETKQEAADKINMS